MTPEEKRVRIKDKRRVAPGEDAGETLVEGEDSDVLEGSDESATEVAEHDYLDDLKRLQAEFDNYRKRMLRQQTQMAEAAGQRVIESLLPVLDDFERAVAHGEGGDGVALVYRHLVEVLEKEGLQQIPAEGHPFDPQVHEAVELVDDDSVSESVVRRVYRAGYRFKGRLLRPAMVVVAHAPGEPTEEREEEAAEA